jgi:glycosyltransferase involved in cell wall biosynthesis
MSEKACLVTAVTPIRTFRAQYVERAVGSVTAQTSPRWRLIVVDDGAVDLAPVLAAFDDPRIALVRNDGTGFAPAINTGIRTADTPFVALLFGDDEWAPSTVEVLTRHIERFPDVDFFHSSRAFIDDESRPLSGVYHAREHFELADFVPGSPVKHLLCFRRDLAIALGGIDETLPPVGPDDWDFPWCMAEHGARFQAIDDCLYRLRDHRDHFRLTTHQPRTTHTMGLRRILRKHGVDRRRIRGEVARAKRTYLRQCVYRSPFDRWLKQRLGYDPHRGWHQTYRR